MTRGRSKIFNDSTVIKDSPGQEHNIRRFSNSKDTVLLNIVFLHDLYDHHGRYIEFFEELLATLPFPTRIHAFDLYGQGLSVGHRGDLEDFNSYTDPLRALLNSFKDNEDPSKLNIVLMGVGLGALIIMRYLEMNDTNVTSRIAGFIVLNPLLLFHEKLGLEKDPANLVPLSTIRLNLNIITEDLTDSVEKLRQIDGDLLNLKFLTKRKFEIIRDVAAKVRHASYFINNPSLFLISGDDKIYDQSVSKLFYKGLNSVDARMVLVEKSKHDLLNSKRLNKVISLMTKWLSTRRKDS
jgi:alpha-beta hydrolase superfamily lysophospholipase